jgi:hypothetical protein
VSGSSEVLLFECDKLITSWDLEDKKFHWTKRSKCISDLEKFANNGTVTEDIFVDACLLSGTPFLPALPSLSSPNRADLLKPHGAIRMIMSTSGKTGHSAVINNHDDPRVKQMEYVDRYQKARSAIRNHPIYTIEGKIEPLNTSSMPNDAVNYLQSRLPDEVYHYLSAGLINSRVLQWRTTCHIFDVPPMDGGDSPEYRSLVSSKLTPLRTTTVSLLSSSLHNWYRHKNLEQRSWFSEPTAAPQEIRVVGTQESLSIVDTWNVKEATFKDAIAKHKVGLYLREVAHADIIQGCGHLGAAVLSLQNADFTSKTVSKKNSTNPLSTKDEILYNSIWRFLALREYVDAKHNLTGWGKVLAAAISGLKGRPDLEDAAVIAVELLRFGSLNADTGMFPTYNGAPMRGSSTSVHTHFINNANTPIAKDQQFNMLVSRVAGLGELRHRPIGFTGPLSQHLLGYNSVINVVRQTLRDLVEVASTHMFLTGCCARSSVDLSQIAMRYVSLSPLTYLPC